MTSIETTSSLATLTSEMTKHKRARFALLARVGRQKKEVSQLREETEFYFGIATDLLALSTELVEFLQRAEATAPGLKAYNAVSTSRLHHSIKRLLRSYPSDSDLQKKWLSTLTSDGLATMVGVTADGYLSLSSTQVVNNVARVIEATKERRRKTSSASATTTR